MVRIRLPPARGRANHPFPAAEPSLSASLQGWSSSDLGRPQPERAFRAADAEGKTDGCSCPGLARRDQRCQMFRGRKTVAAAPAKQASPQVPKLTAHAASCDVPPNRSSVMPNRSVPRKLAPKPMQE
jgi:hypothetical protein